MELEELSVSGVLASQDGNRQLLADLQVSWTLLTAASPKSFLSPFLLSPIQLWIRARIGWI